ncbi:MAG: hypothetical protein VKJ66_04060 [Synechococcus sp.]|nr:hypothetical protein [Synechococcus sp.]
MMNKTHDADDEQVKEVYARFGLAVYFAQVLEHGIVNALVVLYLIPTRRHLARSADEWAGEVDAFMDRHFQAPMGRMMSSLRDVTYVDDDLEQLLNEALRKRNWLVHHFFRERASEFMSSPGREQMISEIDGCRDLFQSADKRLEAIVVPLRRKAGLTDELFAREYERMQKEARR